jgi:hypothetical protein
MQVMAYWTLDIRRTRLNLTIGNNFSNEKLLRTCEISFLIGFKQTEKRNPYWRNY